MVPRSATYRLDSVIDAWIQLFPVGQVVAPRELRSVARQFLKLAEVDTSATSDNGFERAAAITRLGVGPESDLSSEGEQDRGFSEAKAERQCTLGLRAWLVQLDKSPRWTHLPGVVPGEAPVEIDKIFVDLFAISERDMVGGERPVLDGRQRLSRRILAAEYPVISAATMVARTLERCIVLGEPGSGKSTLVQWIARAVNKRQITDFDLSIVIKLSAYAAALSERPALSLVEFFFESLETAITDWRPAAYWLRKVASEKHRSLLLLDGWDEVPGPMRDSVRHRIDQEACNFVTVITSRPSGLPRELQGSARADLYHIAGLAPRATEELVRNLLVAIGRPDLFDLIFKRLMEDANLKEMATNPFLLGLVVRMFVRSSAQGASPRSLAEVYHQVTAWIREQHDAAAENGARLTAEHITGLRRLAHGLLFEMAAPRYLFRSQELGESLGTGSTEPVFRSRFVNRVDPVFDEFVFLHATFQEYFAAAHAASLADEELNRFLDRAFVSVSRLIVVEFIAGMGGAVARQCQHRAANWLADKDRFRQVVLKLSRLAAAGHWPADDEHGLGRTVRDELWREIESNAEMALTKAAVQSFAELDAVELCRRAHKATDLNSWALNCMLESLPPAICRQERIFDLLSGAWQDFVGSDVRGEISDDELHKNRVSLVDPAAPEEDRWEAIVFAGAVRDTGAAGAARHFG